MSHTSRDLEGDDDYYMRRMSEILDGFPNIGPPAHPGKLLDHIYIGNQDNADDYDLLPALGITHVLNVAGTRTFDLTKHRYPPNVGIKGFLMIPAEDYEEYDIMQHFTDSITFLDKAKSAGGKALVHCSLGVNRSGAVAAAYMMAHERKTLLKVLKEMKEKRSVVLCNVGFRRQLLKYARCRGLLDQVEPESSSKAATETTTTTSSAGSLSKGQDHEKTSEKKYTWSRNGNNNNGVGESGSRSTTVDNSNSYSLDFNQQISNGHSSTADDDDYRSGYSSKFSTTTKREDVLDKVKDYYADDDSTEKEPSRFKSTPSASTSDHITRALNRYSSAISRKYKKRSAFDEDDEVDDDHDYDDGESVTNGYITNHSSHHTTSKYCSTASSYASPYTDRGITNSSLSPYYSPTLTTHDISYPSIELHPVSSASSLTNGYHRSGGSARRSASSSSDVGGCGEYRSSSYLSSGETGRYRDSRSTSADVHDVRQSSPVLDSQGTGSAYDSLTSPSYSAYASEPAGSSLTDFYRPVTSQLVDEGTKLDSTSAALIGRLNTMTSPASQPTKTASATAAYRPRPRRSSCSPCAGWRSVVSRPSGGLSPAATARLRSRKIQYGGCYDDVDDDVELSNVDALVDDFSDVLSAARRELSSSFTRHDDMTSSTPHSYTACVAPVLPQSNDLISMTTASTTPYKFSAYGNNGYKSAGVVGLSGSSRAPASSSSSLSRPLSADVTSSYRPTSRPSSRPPTYKSRVRYNSDLDDDIDAFNRAIDISSSYSNRGCSSFSAMEPTHSWTDTRRVATRVTAPPSSLRYGTGCEPTSYPW